MLKGSIPPEIFLGLKSLVRLSLEENFFSGMVPPSLANLECLKSLYLDNSKLSDAPPNLYSHRRVQTYFALMNRSPVLRLLNYGTAITAKRQSDTAITKTTTDLFNFLASNEDATRHILSYLDPLYCCVKDRNALLKCWRSLRGVDDEEKAHHRALGVMRSFDLFWCFDLTVEDDLREGFGDDVARVGEGWESRVEGWWI